MLLPVIPFTAKLDVSHFMSPGARRAGFVLFQSTSESAIAQGVEELLDTGVCLFDQAVEGAIFSLMLVDGTQRRDQAAQVQWTIEEPGMYDLMFQVCSPSATATTFDLAVEQYNPGPSYLPVGLAPLPTIYLVTGLIFVGAAFLWVRTLRSETQRHKVHKVHHLMTLLVIIKALALLAESAMYTAENSSGTLGAWAVIWYILNSFRALLLVTVLVLVGTGWSLVKPFLEKREKRLVLIVLPLQVLANIALIVVYESEPGSVALGTWTDILHIVDLLACIIILVPVLWSIQRLQAAGGADDRAANSAVRLSQFKSFYGWTMVYIYFTRVLVLLAGVTLGYKLLWIAPAANQVAALAYYVSVGYKFRPAAQNPYLQLPADDNDADEFGLDDDWDDEEAALHAGRNVGELELVQRGEQAHEVSSDHGDNEPLPKSREHATRAPAAPAQAVAATPNP